MTKLKLTKAEKRETIQQKAKYAPKGGTLAGQMQKMRTSKNYLQRKPTVSSKIKR